MPFRKSTIIEKTQKMASKGQFNKAIQEWEKLANETPNDGNIYNAIGDLHIKASQKEKATEAFMKAADIFQSAGFELKSIAIFKKALKVDPSCVKILEKLANVYTDRGLIGNAIDDYLKAAQYYLQQDNFPASLTVYRKISDLDPKNSDILIEIAEMCQKQGHKDEAVEEYKKVVSLFRAEERSADAEDTIKKILALDPSYAEEKSLPPQKSDTINATSDQEDLLMPTAYEERPLQSTLQVNEDSEKIEPESKPMTDEQTVYSSELTLQENENIDRTNPSESPDKSLDDYLTEADSCLQCDMTEKAIDQLQIASKYFPSSDQPHLKLKDLYSQEGLTSKIVEECSILARLYQEMGEEAKRQNILNELMKINAQEKEVIPSSNETPDSSLDKLDQNEEFQIDLSDLELPPIRDDSAGLSEEESDALANPLGFGEETETIVPEEEMLLDNGEDENKLQLDADPEDETFISPDNLLQETADKDIEEESDSDADSFLIDFEESTLTSEELEATFKDSQAEAVPDRSTDSTHTSRQETNVPASASDDKEPDEEYVDLVSMLSEDLKEEGNETTLDKTIRYFQDKTNEDDNSIEIETQYDLGIAYKEMEMIPEAIKAFESASFGENRFKDAMTMLVACHRISGSLDAAIDTLQDALTHRQSSEEDTITLKYELALLHEELGNNKKAFFLFDELFKIDPTFREVSSKRSASIENEPAASWNTSPDGNIKKHDGKTKKKDRVSYL